MPDVNNIVQSEKIDSGEQPVNTVLDKALEAVQDLINNFYEVDKDNFYRSKQLSPDVLNRYIRRYGIKSIICLRGFNDKEQELYRQEMIVAANNKVEFYHLPMSAVRLSTKKELISLLDLYHTASRPILVHCVGGADRAGEASALWVLEIQKGSKEEALKQLSILYRHLKLLHPAKQYLISIWQGEEWLRNEYDHTNYPVLKSFF